MRRLANFGQNNKRGGWQKSSKLINGEASKNAAIRNFIERKSSNDLVKISTKKHKKYKGSLSTLRITCSFARFSSSRYVVLDCNQKAIVHQTVLWLCLGFTLPLSTVQMN